MLILKTPYQKGRYVFFFVDPSRKLFQFVYKLALNRKLKENLFYWQYSVKQISGIKLGVETLMFEQLEVSRKLTKLLQTCTEFVNQIL